METILANLPMALCLLLGMGLIIVEVFLPGFGLPGVAGIALVGVGTIMAAMHFGTLTAIALLLVIIAVLAVLISWLLRSAAKGDMGKSSFFCIRKTSCATSSRICRCLSATRAKRSACCGRPALAILTGCG
ncbi:MAG: hypothetical protein ACLR07_03920 [Christensenellales bacterium]